MVAVYCPALVVYSDEKSFTTPMLETIILKSCGATIVPDQILDLGDIVFGHFDPRAGGHLDVDGELAGVGAREEGTAQEADRCARLATKMPSSSSHRQSRDASERARTERS